MEPRRPERSAWLTVPDYQAGLHFLERNIWTRIAGESVPVRHPDLRERRLVEDVVLADDSVHVEHVRGRTVDFVRRQRPRMLERHRPPDVVPQRRRVGPIAADR